MLLVGDADTVDIGVLLDVAVRVQLLLKVELGVHVTVIVIEGDPLPAAAEPATGVSDGDGDGDGNGVGDGDGVNDGVRVGDGDKVGVSVARSGVELQASTLANVALIIDQRAGAWSKHTAPPPRLAWLAILLISPTHTHGGTAVMAYLL